MFRDSTTTFNGDISQWNTSSVTNMSSMFISNSAFNQPIENWNVGSVTNMSSMFRNSSFNQPIGDWDTSSVTDMFGMFAFNSAFNQPIGDWVLRTNVDLENFADSSAILPENYARTLIGWANDIFTRDGVVTNRNLGASGRTYSTDTFGDITGEFNNAVDARAYLVNTLGWTITDAGPA